MATILVVAAAAAVAVARSVSSAPLAYVAGVLIALLVGSAVFFLVAGDDLATVDRVRAGLRRFALRDFEARIPTTEDSLAEGIAAEFNALGELLRSERIDVEQRERLLRTIIDAAPMAILLLDGGGRILYSNQTARELFFEDKELAGHNFLSMLAEAPAPFREAVLGREDALFSVDVQQDTETYHLAKRHFEIEAEEHVLIMVRHMTRELRRQEVEVWKKMIRVISHELNNSLAPISSLVHTARMITQQGQPEPRLERVFDTIGDRAKHLQEFVAGYAKFARLPKPRPDHVDLEGFTERLRELAPYAKVRGPKEGKGWFDVTQIEQVLINLLKNAQESGCDQETIELEIGREVDGSTTFVVLDRGCGMSEEVLRSALLPFYSTKEQGTGLGLALSREVVEAHGGRIRIENREEGGLKVRCAVPGKERVSESARAKLTLSRM
jgi:nitrogen fixation/metabolism regulation signal transduction histidine kinase